MRKFVVPALGLILLTLFLIGSAGAVTTNLNDGNSGVLVSASDGANGWWVDGVSQLSMVNWYYRIGSSGGEQSFGALGGSLSVSDRLALCDYASPNDGFTAEASWFLTGGSAGSGTSDLAVGFRLTNTGESPLSIHVFQIADFDVSGTEAGDVGKLMNENCIWQWDGSTSVSESVVSQNLAPSFWYMGTASTLWSSINDTSPTTLGDAPPIGVTTGPGSLAWAFQWDFNIPAGGTVIISKDILVHNTPVPEPASLLALGTGLVGLVGLVVRRRR